jgi:integrase
MNAGRLRNRLNARRVGALLSEHAKRGRHADGGGLYLSVGNMGARRWVFLFRWNGRLREMGLGSAHTVSLARAREKAADARSLLADGQSPIEAKRASQKVPEFGTFAKEVVQSLKSGWRNEKHAKQWESTLAKDGAAISRNRVDQITTDDILRVLKPIWLQKPETASRLRGRIERVLDAATAKGFRSGENPARWKGHLDQLLPQRQKLTRGHHPAMPFSEVPDFVERLSKREGMAAKALEFLILTAARSGEVREMRWSEFDAAANVWTIPAKRMKAGREHRVPLPKRAVDVLSEVADGVVQSHDTFVFPSAKKKPLSDMALTQVLRRMKIPAGQASVHGFRSSFRDWAGEVSTFPREVAEAALAHVVGDATERAYRRGDALEKRRMLMDSWALFVQREGNPTADVFQLNSASRNA